MSKIVHTTSLRCGLTLILFLMLFVATPGFKQTAHAASAVNMLPMDGSVQEPTWTALFWDYELSNAGWFAIPLPFAVQGNLIWNGGDKENIPNIPTISYMFQATDVTGVHNEYLPFSVGAYSFTQVYNGNGSYYTTIYAQDANNCFYNPADVVYCGDNWNTYHPGGGGNGIFMRHYESVSTDDGQFTSDNFTHRLV